MKQEKRSGRREAGQGWALEPSELPSASATRSKAVPSTPPLARLRLEKRRGKPVTVAALEGLDAAARKALGKELKTRCGSGGTVKDSEVELQGDHRDVLRVFLPQRGLQVRG